MSASVAIVVIGRNEGDRLRRCLDALPDCVHRIYVDSASVDGSTDLARSKGVTVIELSGDAPMTAARARNAGWQLYDTAPFIQMIDGDCELEHGWLRGACDFLEANPGIAVVFGRRRERDIEASIYNRLCDDEWNVPVGSALSCGGDAMFRLDALKAVGGYDPTLIAGEEPDLCLKLRRAGWRIERLDLPMTVHDAEITRFSQWWRRAQRSGHAFAEHYARNGARSIESWKRQLASVIGWAICLPIIIVVLGLYATAMPSPVAMIAFLISPLAYPIQWLRIFTRKSGQGAGAHFAAAYALLLIAGKFAQAVGALNFVMRRASGGRTALIEYKAAASQ